MDVMSRFAWISRRACETNVPIAWLGQAGRAVPSPWQQATRATGHGGHICVANRTDYAVVMNRRDFLQTAGGFIAAASFRGSALQVPSVRSARTNILEIGYHESGAESGFPVILLHGFPDDAHAYDGVAPILAKAGYRALAVYLRGYGPTRFLDRSQPRMAEQAAIGQDVIDFADALDCRDLRSRASTGAAAPRASPRRCIRIACAPRCSIGGYSIQNTITPPRPSAPEAARRLWYQWYFNTERGRAGLEQNRRALCELLWREWSPTWHFTPEMYAQTAASFDNPDFVDCVIHSYRHRNFNAPGEPRFVEIEKRLAERPPITVPVITAAWRG